MPELYIANISEHRIAFATKNRSMAELDEHAMSDEVQEQLGLPNDAKIFWFARLSVLPRYQGNGEGTLLMKEVCKVMDEKNILILNFPNPYQIEDGPKLIEFYKSFGFVFDDRCGEGAMIRYPNPSLDLKKDIRNPNCDNESPII